jgi:hypothetical protein
MLQVPTQMTGGTVLENIGFGQILRLPNGGILRVVS